MRPNPKCRSWQLVLTVSSGTLQQQQLRLVGVQLKTVGRHPAVYIVYICRQTLLKIMYSPVVWLSHISEYHPRTDEDRNHVAQPAQ